MAAARHVPFVLAGIVAALVAVQPVLGGISDPGRAEVGPLGAELRFDASNLAPGDTSVASLTVANTGTAPGRFELEGGAAGSRLLARALRVVVADGARTLYRGPLSGLGTVQLGTLAAGERRTLTVELELRASAGNAVQGHSATVGLAARTITVPSR